MEKDLISHCKWTKEDEDIIRDLYTEKTDYELWEQLLRSRRSIRTKRQRMWLFLYFQEDSAPIKNEQWVNFDEKLEVSNKGRIRKDWIKYLKLHIHKTWYVMVSINWSNRYLHNIIREWFKWPIPEWLEIDHKDCNKLNNALWNLELVTHSENMKRAYKNNCWNNFFGRNEPLTTIPQGSTLKWVEVPSSVTENADGEDIV